MTSGPLNTALPETCDTLLKDATRAEKVAVTDAQAILYVVARWVGWHRLESEQALTPVAQRKEAERLAEYARLLCDGMQKMSPALRAGFKEGMRRLNEPMPDFARIEACFIKAMEYLPTVRTGKRQDEARDRAIRETYNAIRENTTPAMKKGPARALAAGLVAEAAGVEVPSDADELRRITG